MDEAKAVKILRQLADGLDPKTGKSLRTTSPFNQPDSIRALLCGIDAIHATSEKVTSNKTPPPMAGGKWDEEELAHLVEGFESGSSLEDLAAAHQRTKGAIRSRLVKLGYFEQLKARNQAS